MSVNLKCYRVFIASPSGLEDERRAFANVIDEYNSNEAIHRKVIFRALGWEDTFPGIGRPQSIINEDLKQCDYFIMVLHDRWGSHPGNNKNNASSGTEEEYLLAWECCKDDLLPMKQIICAFKSVPPNQLADLGPELQKVLSFKKQLESAKNLFYSNFSSLDEFKLLIRKNLGRWLRDDNGSGPGGYFSPYLPQSPLVDENVIADSYAFNESHTDKDESIETAKELAKEGKLVDAEIEFSKIIIDNPTENHFLTYSEFLIGLGQIDKAIAIIDRAIEVAGNNKNLSEKANAYTHKGIVLHIRGELVSAEKLHGQAFEIYELIGRYDGMAISYGNLGMIYRLRGELNEAESIFNKALNINKKLGRIEGVATNYVNLGIIHETKGELNDAESMFKKALEIYEKLEQLDGMATCYGSIANVLQTKGDLDSAEELYRKSLDIDKKLERVGGMATTYGNIGIILQSRGGFAAAEEMHKKALEINEKLGHLEGMASNYGNLGTVLQNIEKFDEAEKMYCKALELNEKLGRIEGMAINYGNLGGVLLSKGDLDAAEKMCGKALEFEEKLGRLEGMASNYGNIGVICQRRGELIKAEEMYRKSLEIEEKIGRLEGMASDYINIGNILALRDELDAAEENYKKASRIAEKVGLQYIKEIFNRNMKELRERKSDR